MTRALGVDVGTVRTGLAVSDPGGLVATPLSTLEVGRDDPSTADGADALAVRLAEIAVAEACETVVVGLPRALSGRDTPSTALARRVVEALRRRGVAVATWDERLSSAEAERVLLAAGRRRAERRTARDRIAATLVLQGWLDARRARG